MEVLPPALTVAGSVMTNPSAVCLGQDFLLPRVVSATPAAELISQPGFLDKPSRSFPGSSVISSRD